MAGIILPNIKTATAPKVPYNPDPESSGKGYRMNRNVANNVDTGFDKLVEKNFPDHESGRHTTRNVINPNIAWIIIPKGDVRKTRSKS